MQEGVQCRLQVQHFTAGKGEPREDSLAQERRTEEGNLSACGGTGTANTAEQPTRRLGTGSPRGPGHTASARECGQQGPREGVSGVGPSISPASTGQCLISRGPRGVHLLPKSSLRPARKGNVGMFPYKRSISVPKQTQQSSCCARKIENI